MRTFLVITIIAILSILLTGSHEELWIQVKDLAGIKNNTPNQTSPLNLIASKDYKAAGLQLMIIDEEKAWETLGSLSTESRDQLFREMISTAMTSYDEGHFTKSENILTWIEEHSGADYEAIKLAKAEIYLRKKMISQCSEILKELAGVKKSFDHQCFALWSKSLKDHYAANIMINNINLNPEVENLGIREDIYIEDTIEPVATNSTANKNNRGNGISSSLSGKSKLRNRGIRFKFNDIKHTEDKLNWFKENLYKGMSTDELTELAGKPSRIIASDLPTDGLWAMVEKSERWDYVTDDGRTGIVLTIINKKVTALGKYKIPAPKEVK